MKIKYNGILIGVILATSLVFSTGCAADSNEKGKAKMRKTAAKMEKVDHSGKEYTSAFICPMHCENSGDDSEGKCPVCNMDYIENYEKVEGQTGNGSRGVHDHNDHNHGNHEHGGVVHEGHTDGSHEHGDHNHGEGGDDHSHDHGDHDHDGQGHSEGHGNADHDH